MYSSQGIHHCGASLSWIQCLCQHTHLLICCTVLFWGRLGHSLRFTSRFWQDNREFMMSHHWYQCTCQSCSNHFTLSLIQCVLSHQLVCCFYIKNTFNEVTNHVSGKQIRLQTPGYNLDLSNSTFRCSQCTVSTRWLALVTKHLSMKHIYS